VELSTRTILSPSLAFIIHGNLIPLSDKPTSTNINVRIKLSYSNKPCMFYVKELEMSLVVL
jgi:hypothetical protein